MKRSAALIVGLILGGCALSWQARPAGASAAAPTPTQAFDFAREVNLRATDLPGFTVGSTSGSSGSSGAEGGFAHCLGSRAPTAQAVSEGSSPLLEHGGDLAFESRVVVGRTAVDAKAVLSLFRSSGFLGCFKAFFLATSRRSLPAGATLGPASVTTATPAAVPHGEGFEIETTVTILLDHQSFTSYLDLLGFFHQQATVLLSAVGLEAAPSASTTEHLLGLLLGRASSHSL